MSKKTSKKDRPSDLHDLSEQIASVLEAADPGVVRVRGGGRRSWAGIVWSEELVVTVAHPLRRRDGITVRLADGRRLDAELLGWDGGADLALLKVDPGDQPLTPPEWSDGADLRVGHLVLTAARPRSRNGAPGALRATMGLVSALTEPGESWRTRSGGLIDRFIDVDASLPRGFSGGPLLDSKGRVLGLNTPLLRRGGTTVPTATVRRVVGDLKEHGAPRRGWLGVGVATGRLPAALAEAEGQETAVILTALDEEGPAARSGLLLGDVLLSLDGERLDDFHALHAALSARPDSTQTARVLRAGEPTEIEVEIGHKERRRAC